MALFRQGQLDQAIAKYSAAIDRDERYPLPRLARAIARAEKNWGRLEKERDPDGKLRGPIEEDYTKAFELGRTVDRDYLGLAGPKGPADLARLKERIEILAAGHYMGGLANMTSEKLDEGIAEFSRAVALAPEDPHFRYARGFFLRKMKRHAEALRDFDEVVRLHADGKPSKTGFLELSLEERALTHLDLGDAGRALPDLERALQLDPKRKSLLEARAKALAMKGATARALAGIAMAKAIDAQDDDKIAQWIKDLQSDQGVAWQKALDALAAEEDPRAIDAIFAARAEWAGRGFSKQLLIIEAALRDKAKGPRACQLFLARLKENDPVAAQALWRFSEPDVAAALAAALKAPSPRVRAEAAYSLGRQKADAALPHLIQALADADSSVRKNAAGALGSIGNRRAAAPLIALLKNDPEWSVRGTAARSLGEIGDASALEALTAALAQTNESYYKSEIETALSLVRKAQASPGGGIICDPPNGAQAVLPTLDVITIKFPADMRTDGFNVVPAADGRMPEPRGDDPFFFKDARTFVMQVKLAPDTAYAFSLNSARWKGFKLADGTPLPPTAIRFATSPARQVRPDSGRPPRPGDTTVPDREITVAADGRGDHLRLADAVAAAKPLSTIKVMPGVYRESIVLDKELTIEGSGDRTAIIVECENGPCLTMKAEKASVKNLTLRSAGAKQNKQFFAVDVGEGTLRLAECAVTSDSLAGIAVHNSGVLNLFRCRIHDCKQGGLFFYDKGQGTVEDCDVTGNTLAGIECKSGGNPVVRLSRVFGGKAAGVYLHTEGNGRFESCDLHANALANVQIMTGATGTFAKCRMYDSKQGGVFVNNNGAGAFEECEVFGNALAGVEITAGGKPTFTRCRLRANKGGGAYLHDKGEGVFNSCEVYGNDWAGVGVSLEAAPAFRGCTIRENKASGAFIFDKGKGLFENCTFHGNGLAGIEVKSGADPFVSGCTVRDGNAAGVFVHAQGLGRFEDCDIYGNKLAGVEIGADGDPLFRKCRIYGGKGAGVRVNAKGKGLLEDCDISKNAGKQIQALPDSALKTKDCRIGEDGPAAGGEAPKPPPLPPAAGDGLAPPDQEAAIAAIRKLDGEISFDERLPHKPVVSVVWQRADHLRDEDLVVLKSFPRLQGLRLPGARVSDAGFAHLRGLRSLRSVDLSETKLTDAGLAYLSDAVGMLRMNLVDTGVAGAGMKHLRRMEQLEQLHLSGTKVDDAGLAELKGLTALTRLKLNNTPVTDRGIEFLAGMAQMQQLSLSGTEITDACLPMIGKLSQLEKLDLSFTKVGDQGLRRLAGLSKLKDLSLVETRVTDAGLGQLASMPQLERVDLTLCNVTKAGLRSLQRQMPRTAVVGDGEGAASRPEGLSFDGVGTPPPGEVRRVAYRNPVAGFSIVVPEDWEMATAASSAVEIAIDAQPGASLRAQPALWFFYAAKPPLAEAQALANDLRTALRADAKARPTGREQEWEVTAALAHPRLGRLSTRWLCRQERGVNYVVGAAVRESLAGRFSGDIDAALQSCRLIDHPPLRVFQEPSERAYRLLLPQGWKWEGTILRTAEIPGYFSWKAQSADGLTGCFTSPPGVFSLFQDYMSARTAAGGVVLQGLREQLGDVRLEEVHPLPRASDYFRDAFRELGMNPRVDKARADYRVTVNGTPVRIRVDIVALMQDQTRIPDARFQGRGNWFLFTSGVWAPVVSFEQQIALARGVQASHRTSPKWIAGQLSTIGKVLVARNSAIDEAAAGWDAYIRDMERVPDPDGGPIQEVPNRDGRVWKDPDGIMWRVPPEGGLEDRLKNQGWKLVR